jgi:hypothetical protein
VACHDFSSYSTGSTDQYAGCVVPASFVLAGVSPTTELCLTLDGSHLQDAPGTISSSDGRFATTPLRPIPQIWSDPLSTFSFGDGHLKDLVYMASPRVDGGGASDVTVVVSLMVGRRVEVRLLRGAPPVTPADADSPPSADNIFAVFPLTLQSGGCASLSAARCAPDAQ